MVTSNLSLMETTHRSVVLDGIAEHEQILKTSKPFWVFFVGNIGIPTWLMGVLVAGMGVSFVNAMLVLVIGNLIGAILPAALSTLGPKTRLPAIESSRLALGRDGKRLPALLAFAACVGWDCINNLMAASALVLFFGTFGLTAPLWLILGILIGVQMLIGIYGHHVVQETSKYTGILLGIAFLIIGLVAMRYAPPLIVPVVTDQFGSIVAAFILTIAFSTAGWTTWTADYTRYLPSSTPTKSIFITIFSSISISSIVLMFFGYVTFSAITEQTPDGIMQALQGLSGGFAPLVLLLIGLSSIPVNAINDTSASYNLISSGIRVSRPTAAAVGAIIGYLVCLLASETIIGFFENCLLFFAHWIAPWSAIVLVHWLVIGRRQQGTAPAVPAGITLGGWVFIGISALSIIMFSANSLYTGLLSPYLGGLDIGPYVGFVVAGLLYYALLKSRPQA